MSIVIGLTGPTGSGKSSTSGIAENFGFQVMLYLQLKELYLKLVMILMKQLIILSLVQ